MLESNFIRGGPDFYDLKGEATRERIERYVPRNILTINYYNLKLSILLKIAS